MQRRMFATGLVVLTLGLAGPAAAGDPVPLKGSLEGVVTRGVPDGDYVDVLVEGQGASTQLGRFVFAFPHTVYSPTRTAEGTYYIQAANGDRLIADGTGIATPTFIDGVFHLYIDEVLVLDPDRGTGRFAGATGGFTVQRLYNPATGLTFGSFEGSVSPSTGNPYHE
jgi:hypothetical protein